MLGTYEPTPRLLYRNHNRCPLCNAGSWGCVHTSFNCGVTMLILNNHNVVLRVHHTVPHRNPKPRRFRHAEVC